MHKHKSTPRKNYLVFKAPMPAEGREECILGVAFERPDKATQGEYTPQGPSAARSFADAGSGNNPEAPNPSVMSGIMRWLQPQAVNTPCDAATQGLQDEINPTYGSPCPWPKDLVDRIYPNVPAEAIGVEASLRNLTDAAAELGVMNVIAMGLRIKKEHLDEVIIPVMRRYDLESPEARILDLLHNKRYRDRLINLFERQSESTKPKVVYVAAHLITCAGLSMNKVREDAQEFQGHAADPTNTVPITIKGNVHHIRRSTLQGSYKSSVILAMGYRALRYEKQTPEQPPKSFWGRFGWTPRTETLQRNAHEFRRTDASGICDVFWIDDEDTKGDSPAFFGPKEQMEKQGVFHGVELVDADSSDASEPGEDRFPAGFFGKVPVEGDSDEEENHKEEENHEEEAPRAEA